MWIRPVFDTFSAEKLEMKRIGVPKAQDAADRAVVIAAVRAVQF
jgi:hypothetical protein